jgi:hypothetical protein
MLLEWALPQQSSQTPLNLTVAKGAENGPEAVLDVPYAPKEERGKMVDAAAHAVAAYLETQGVKMAYHHHMGSFIEDPEDIDWLMESTTPDVSLCFDTGHLLFGGGDVMATLRRWVERNRPAWLLHGHTLPDPARPVHRLGDTRVVHVRGAMAVELR